MGNIIDGRIAANKKRQKITDDDILNSIGEGLTRQEIADKYGVHVENLARRMRQLGVHATYAKSSGCFKRIFGDCWHYVSSHDKYAKYKYPEFQYLESKRENDSGTKRIRLKCKTCGSIIERAESTFRQKGIECECFKEKKQLEEGRAKMVRFLIALAQSKTPKKCSCCGKTFYSRYASARYCSDRCKRRMKAKGASIRHRCKKYGVYYDSSVSPKMVFERDKYTCKICGLICDVNDKSWNGVFGPYSPTVDHIVALANGGTHTWDNVQCAHAICNSYKRDLITA